MNYNEKMKKIIKDKSGEKLLLHSCCAPCSSSVIRRLEKYFDISVLFYNPNIEPIEEYLKRKSEQIKLLKKLKVKYIDIDYLNNEFREKIAGFENDKEGGKRCFICYNLRLNKTASIAKEKGFDYFTTTLTVSPYKDSKVINLIGESLASKNKIKFLNSDFKKEEGYKKSIYLSKKFNLYRQDYCGCLFSKGE